MALPSQIERSAEMSRPVMSRGGRKSGLHTNRLLIGAAVLLVAAGAGYGIWRLTAGAGPASVQAATPPTSTPTPAPKPAVTPPVAKNTPPVQEPKPLVSIDQGKPAAPGATLPKSLGEAMNGTQPGSGASPAGGNPPPPPTDGGKPAPLDLVSPPSTGPDANAPKAEPPSPASPITATGSTQGVRSQIESGDRAMAANKLVEARVLYSKALLNPEIAKGDAELLRSKLSTINDDLVFSPKVTPGDPLTETYTVAAGDALERIRRKRELSTEWMLIQRVNKLASPNDLQVGQKLKLVRGPFHAVVTKSDFRLDLFAGSPDDPENWIYIRSYRVGLGESNGTPLGSFVIKSKQKNPPWTNPRNGEKFTADDPKNPIGEYWLGWQGLGESAVHAGFGLHGTIDPGSIGQARSMGCVRMLPDDIAQVYEMLALKVSTVKVVP